ncbi:MAG: exosortase/archaeosortase family protein [Fibrobacter sp.]|nr:exosortase/archaeosortase family protein [Fibrobacter sp.]
MRQIILLLSTSLLLFLFCFSRPIFLLYAQISRHNWVLFVIPFLFMMIWCRKGDMLKVRRSGLSFSAGAILCAASAAASFFGVPVPLLLFQALPFVFISGISFVFFGSRTALLYLCPISYLFFFTAVIAEITPFLINLLQVISTAGSWYFLDLSGLQVIKQGTSLVLPNVILNVNKSCSGFNQTIALFSFAVPLAWVRLNRGILRLILIASVLPLSAGMNIVRIILIGFWNYEADRLHVHGPFDILLLPFLYPALLLALVLFSEFLLRLTNYKEQRRSKFTLFYVKDSKQNSWHNLCS